MISIIDGMSAFDLANELVNAVDKTGDSISEAVDIQEHTNIQDYRDGEVIPASFLFRYMPSLPIFLYAFSATNSTIDDQNINNMVNVMINIAFGKNCEKHIFNIGHQLIQFGAVVGDEIDSAYSDVLKGCKTILDIKTAMDSDISFKSALTAWPAFTTLIAASTYATEILGI